VFGRKTKFIIIVFFLLLSSALIALFLLSIPDSYDQCMKIYGKSDDYEHNNFHCVLRVRDSEFIKYNSCLIRGGNKSGGLVGCSLSGGCTRSSDTCELVYYKNDFVLPSSYKECINYSKSFDAIYPRLTKMCMMRIDSWGYDHKKANLLYDRCLNYSGNTNRDTVWSERSGKSCLITFTKD